MARTTSGIKLNGFVSKIVKDPKRPPKVRILRGYVGRSDKRNFVRVYLDAELRRSVDVPTDGIVHSEAVPAAASTLGAVYVWVQEDAKIVHAGSWAASEDPTTMATGEEGGGDPTTMATGEEGLGVENPLDLVVNPFGRF